MASGQGSKVRFTCVGLTDVGRIREHNEDNFLVADLGADKRGTSGEVLSGPVQQRGLALVVADGMGGAAAGEVASQMAVDTLHGEFKNADLGGTVKAEQNVIALLETGINKANESIFKKGQESKEHQGMGTTLTGAVVLGDSLYLSQVGDSRGYVLRKGKLVQMTRDQSLIGQLIEEGTLTEEQAEKLGGKNIILQALGVEETLKIDSKRYDILSGDVLLLCSDGLSGMVPDPKIEEILAGEPDLGKAARKLIEAANAGGGKDNITCILAKFEGEGLRDPLPPMTAAQTGGGRSPPPPPPRSKAGRNSVIATAAVLFVVGAVILWPKPKRLLLTVTPVGSVLAGPLEGKVTVSGEGFGPEEKPLAGDAIVEFSLPKDRDYEVVVEAKGYLPEKRTVSTRVDTVEIPETVRIVRVPGRSLDLVPPAFLGKPLSRVRVRFVPGEDQEAIEGQVLAQPGKVEFESKFPAGEWKAEVTRDGFEPRTQPFEVKSDEAHSLALEPLAEAKGRLSVNDLPEGAKVSLFDEDERLGDLVEVLPSRGTGPIEVRATKVTVRAEKEGYEFEPRAVDVAPKKDASVTFGTTKCIATVTGPGEGSAIFTPLFEAPGVRQQTVDFKKKGDSSKRFLHPGNWRVKWEPAAGAIPPEKEWRAEPGKVDSVDIGKMFE
jgi:serine/threonine protein phosphatase PrpC